MLREMLRIKTSEHHESIEQKLALTETFKSRKEYVALLEAFYGFYFSMEKKLETFAAEFRRHSFELAPRHKLSWIAEDLQKLGYLPSQLSKIPHCPTVPQLYEFESAVGCLYVLEGSTLGGQIIARHLNQSLSITPQNGGRFFSGYGPYTGKMWQEFVNFLNTQEKFITDHETVVQAACDTFKCLEAWICQFKKVV
jgi:heme oxygenase (biliverdin-IX-beta and delta-forming)